jgi:hypothetical protein
MTNKYPSRLLALIIYLVLACAGARANESAHGSITVWTTGCRPGHEGARLAVSAMSLHVNLPVVNSTSALSGGTSGKATFTLPEGSWTVNFDVEPCGGAEIVLGALAGHRRSVSIRLEPPPSAPRRGSGEPDIYDANPKGNVAGLLPKDKGVLIWAEGQRGVYPARIEDGAYYLDAIPIGEYSLHIQGANWSRVQKLTVRRDVGLIRMNLH